MRHGRIVDQFVRTTAGCHEVVRLVMHLRNSVMDGPIPSPNAVSGKSFADMIA